MLPKKYPAMAFAVIALFFGLTRCGRDTSNGTTGTYNIQVPIDMVDYGLSSNTTAVTFARTRTSLNTNDYDGTVTYAFEVVATNANASALNVTLLDSAGTTAAIISVPGSTANATRLTAVMTPTAGANDYRIATVGSTVANQLVVLSGKMLVNQVGATKTKVYVPLSAAIYNSSSNTDTVQVDTSTSTTFTQTANTLFPIWAYTAANWATLDSTAPFTFEAVMSTANVSAQAKASLFIANTSTQVAASELTVATTTYSLASAALPAGALVDGSQYEVKVRTSNMAQAMKIARAGLWINISSLSKGEVYYRVSRGFTGLSASTTNPNQRMQWDATLFSSPNGVLVYEDMTGTCSTAAGATVALFDAGTSESATTGAALTVPAISLGTTRVLARSAALAPVSGNRYISRVERTAGTVNLVGENMVVTF